MNYLVPTSDFDIIRKVTHCIQNIEDLCTSCWCFFSGLVPVQYWL